MRQYIFAKVMCKVDSIDLSEAIESLIQEYPNENISEQIKTEKVVLVSALTIPSKKKKQDVRFPAEFCKDCQTTHKKYSKKWKQCLKPEKQGSINP